MSQVSTFHQRLFQLNSEYEFLLRRPNTRIGIGNGIYERYKNPVLTPLHVPLHWKYDLNPETNPYFLMRMGVNGVYHAGAVDMGGRIKLVVGLEGYDRKSFFAVAESRSGVDEFQFRDFPIEIPETEEPDLNTYDMRLCRHEDGWIYGAFSADRRAPAGHTAEIITHCSVARSRNLIQWERLPDLPFTGSGQGHCVLHPEFINGQYAIYQSGAQGIQLCFCPDIENPVIERQVFLAQDPLNPLSDTLQSIGPAPIRTEKGWLHLAHGIREVAGGSCQVLYTFLADLEDPTRMLHRPGGYLLAPEGQERIGDKMNTLFSNGWILRPDGSLFLFYSSSNTRMHVATSSIERMLDYVIHTPEDGQRSAACVQQRFGLIRENQRFLGLEHF